MWYCERQRGEVGCVTRLTSARETVMRESRVSACERALWREICRQRELPERRATRAARERELRERKCPRVREVYEADLLDRVLRDTRESYKRKR